MKGYRTVLFNVIMTVVAVMTMVNPEAQMPSEAAVSSAVNLANAATVGVWGVGNLLLRAITSSPIFRKD